MAFFSYALEMVGEGRDCLADSLSNDGIDDDDGSFVTRAGDANGGHLRLLAGWRINCSLAGTTTSWRQGGQWCSPAGATTSWQQGGWRCSLAGAMVSRWRVRHSGVDFT